MDRFESTLGPGRGLDGAQRRERERDELAQAQRELTASLAACARDVADPAITGDANILNWVTGSHQPPVDDELTGEQAAAVLAAWNAGCAQANR